MTCSLSNSDTDGQLPKARGSRQSTTYCSLALQFITRRSSLKRAHISGFTASFLFKSLFLSSPGSEQRFSGRYIVIGSLSNWACPPLISQPRITNVPKDDKFCLLKKREVDSIWKKSLYSARNGSHMYAMTKPKIQDPSKARSYLNCYVGVLALSPSKVPPSTERTEHLLDRSIRKGRVWTFDHNELDKRGPSKRIARI